MNTCPICSFSNNPDDSVYCTECGAKLTEEPQPAAAPEPQPAAAPEPQPAAAPEPQSVAKTGGVLKLPDNSDIPVELAPKVVGRMELLEYLKTLQDIDPMVISRQHFTISQENDKYYIEDGNTAVQDKPSANHTYLNGVDITDKGQQELKDGDIIDLANSVKLTFRL